MKMITITTLVAIALTGCGKQEETIPMGSKENLDKGMAVIRKHQQELIDSDKKLMEDEARRNKASSTPPAK